MSGLTEGSLIDFYTADSAQPKNQNSIAKGIISRLGLSKSEVKFDTAVENIVGAWGFLKQLNNPENYESVSEMRADVLRKAKSSATNIQVEIELIPLNSNKERISKTFKTGEQFQIKAINKGTQRAFFQIIGIQPDNKVLLIKNSQKRYANLTEFELLLNNFFVHDRSAKTFRFENDITIFNYTFTVLEK